MWIRECTSTPVTELQISTGRLVSQSRQKSLFCLGIRRTFHCIRARCIHFKIYLNLINHYSSSFLRLHWRAESSKTNWRIQKCKKSRHAKWHMHTSKYSVIVFHEYFSQVLLIAYNRNEYARLSPEEHFLHPFDII